MATEITALPVYGGVVPNKDLQQQPIFDAAGDTWIAYEYDNLVPSLNTFVTQANLFAIDVEAYRDTAITYAGLSQTYATNSGVSATDSENSALASASSAGSAGTALAAANGILGLGIGTSYTNSEGHLIMFYDDGTLAEPPEISATGHLLITV